MQRDDRIGKMGLILIVDNKGVGSRSLPRMIQDHRARVLVKSPPFNYADLDHSGIIISGGSLDWARHLEILGWYKQLITTADVPILGICLGHRIIGVTQGARTRRMPVPENGDVEITFNKDYPLLPGTRKAIVKEQHQYELLT
ncbi:MAG: hypothetical protein ACE5KG_01200, partial [Nitrososphaerales archaeon]